MHGILDTPFLSKEFFLSWGNFFPGTSVINIATMVKYTLSALA
jgi:hypothetical protein